MAKPRGSISGLKRHQRSKEVRTAAALSAALEELKASRPNSLWSKADLCRAAGLASQNALSNPVHAELLGLLLIHNDEIAKLRTGSNKSPKHQPVCSELHLLHSKCEELASQRDLALSQSMTYLQEAAHLKERVEFLEVKIRRLEREISGLGGHGSMLGMHTSHE
jgi:hypothetical protein